MPRGVSDPRPSVTSVVGKERARTQGEENVMELLLLGVAIVGWWMWTRVRRDLADARHSARRPVTPGLLICHQGPWGYWLTDERLMRAPVRGGVADWSRAMEVDPLEIDLPPAHLLEIMDALEDAQAQMGITRRR